MPALIVTLAEHIEDEDVDWIMDLLKGSTTTHGLNSLEYYGQIEAGHDVRLGSVEEPGEDGDLTYLSVIYVSYALTETGDGDSADANLRAAIEDHAQVITSIT